MATPLALPHNRSVEQQTRDLEIRLEVPIEAKPRDVFDYVMDWERQSEWVHLTEVRVTSGTGRTVGDTIVAFTGIRLGKVRLGFNDTMTITHWDSRRVDVLHTGRVIRGAGQFEVMGPVAGPTTFVWSEQLDVPLGALGKLGWRLTQPLVMWSVRDSLRRLAQHVESRPRLAA